MLAGIRPDEVHLNLPIRPPSESWVKPSESEGLGRARNLLGEVAKVVQLPGGVFILSAYEDVMDPVIGVITRHPIHQLRQRIDEGGKGMSFQERITRMRKGRIMPVNCIN